MKTVLAFIVLGTFSFSLGFQRSYLEGLWEDPNERAWDEPESIRLNRKVYQCTDNMGCGCPMLLCTGDESCTRHDENPIKCKLTEDYENIDLQNAKTGFFVKGDCKCNTL
ncbi:hypothetical protein ACROYT_G017966 [Oculina patagonica]